MTRMFVASLRAAKLVDIYLKSTLMCARQCTALDDCYYMAIDTLHNLCTCYGQGTNLYNTTKLQVYVLKLTQIEVKKRES